jgi:hypothetical protein
MSEMDIHAADPTETPDDREEDPMDLEAPEADSAEQQRPVRQDDEEPRPRVPYDVNEADAAEQSRIVELDEDDYR